MSNNTKLALSFRIFKNGQLIREETLTQAVIKVGKVPSAHLRIEDESVSRMHAVIEVTNLEVCLIDLGSTRGTFVNDKKINKAKLASGDVITIGDVRVELAIGSAADSVRRTPAEGTPVRPPVTPPVLPAAALQRPPVSALPPPLPRATGRVASVAPVAPVARVAPVAPVARVAPVAPVASAAPVAPVALAEGTAPVASPLARSVALPIEPARAPVAVQRPIAEQADELAGARAVEVAAMLGDSVIGVKHCMDPRSGKVTPATWGFFAAGVACLLTSVIAFAVSLHNESTNTARRHEWTVVQHKPAYAFRPDRLGPGIDWMAFGGLALGLAGLTLGLLRMRKERTNPYYRIGTAPGVELAIEQAPLPAFPLVAPSGDDFVFNYGDGIDGELIVDGKSTPFAELAATGRARPSAATAGAIEVPIPPKARIRARAGQTTFMVSAVARPRRHAAPILANFQNRTLGYVAGSLAVHLGILAFLQMLPPDAEGVIIDDKTSEDPGVQVRGTASTDPAPDKVEDSGDSGANSKEPSSASMKLPSGKAGASDAPVAERHMRVEQTQASPQMSQEEAIRIAREAGILGSMTTVNSFRTVTGSAAFSSGFDVTSYQGGYFGEDGDSQGNFAGGVSGNGPGGGCRLPPCGTIGAGGYNTIGLGPRAGGNIGFPMHDGPGGPGHHAAVPVVGKPEISASSTYDKSIVRRYIRRHLNEISYCYEKQLLAHPNLGGDVKVSFFISPTGSVQSASGEGFDGEVSSCLAGVIKTIEFPAPGEGGGVQVNYPFHFHAPNQ